MDRRKFLTTVGATGLVSALPQISAACEVNDCRLTGPDANPFTGTARPETIRVRVCLRTDLWDLIGQTYWGRSLADTGRPDQRWIALPIVNVQCGWYHVVPGARIGTKLRCAREHGLYGAWVWTPPLLQEGAEYIIEQRIDGTTPLPVNRQDLPAGAEDFLLGLV